MKKTLILIGIVVLLFAGSVWWSKSLQKNDPDVVSQSGFHWHLELVIYVKGEKLEIPQNSGLGAAQAPVHTHDDLPVIHLECEGIVRKEDVMLGRFFKNDQNTIRPVSYRGR
ncbi:MAG: hypothetical protein AAB545_01255, partial [Patescibacteria group bacterium]